MKRRVYITDGRLSLAEYVPAADDWASYCCWREEETQKAYNFRFCETFGEYVKKPVRARFLAAVTRVSDNVCVGTITVSPEHTEPDLAIRIYAPYRKRGYGAAAFALGVDYCFSTLKLDRVYAGCYEGNAASRKMLEKCGFQRHPAGDRAERHYRTGETVWQYDFVKRNGD